MPERFQNIGVVGGGAWGTALAQTVRQSGRTVLLWALEKETVAAINSSHENTLFLSGVDLDPEIEAVGSFERFASCDAVLLVAPVQHSRLVMEQMRPHLPAGIPVVICSKGLEQSSGKLMSEVVQEVLPEAMVAVLSGPSFAIETAQGLPTAVTLACSDEAIGEALAKALGHRALRPYWSDDVTGAQIGGALKNVLAIAAGVVAGKGLGKNAHAALVTRGFAEMVRFGTAMGGRFETLAGLSGLGDLLLTCGSPTSRNMSLGKALGEGRPLDEILAERNSVSEGVYTASAVVQLAQEKGFEMPICAAVADVVSGSCNVDDAVERLLSRPFRSESVG